MVIVKILAVLAALVGSLVVLQEHNAFKRAGIIGGCTEVRSAVADVAGAQWWSCHEGLLTGYPTLMKDGCELRMRGGGRQVWRCPQPIEQPGAII